MAEPGAEPGDHDVARTGPGTVAGRYLRRFWQPVHHSKDLEPGRTMPIKVMGEDFTLYRGEDGTAHVVAYRCAHRGTQLSVGWVEQDCIRCYYHGWKYDGSGQCVEQPGESGRMTAKVSIASYPTREALGLVFAYLGEGDPPPFPDIPGFDEPQATLQWHSFVRTCNWFQSFENALDPLHICFVHRGSGVEEAQWTELPRPQVHESDAGVTLVARRSDGAVFVAQVGMPNMLHMAVRTGPGLEIGLLHFFVPIDDETHQLFGVTHVPVPPEVAARLVQEHAAYREGDLDHDELSQAILRGELRVEDVDPTRTNMGRVQDDVSQVGQGRIVDRSDERLASSDVGVILLRRLFARELRALTAGQPLTEWVSPVRLPAKYFEVVPEDLELTSAR